MMKFRDEMLETVRIGKKASKTLKAFSRKIMGYTKREV